MVDVSGVYPKVKIVSTSIPLIELTKFADDQNPIDVEQIEVTGHAIQVCGELVTWEKPSAYIVSVAVLCGTDDDINLRFLLESSHVHAKAGFALAPTVALYSQIGKRNMFGIITSNDSQVYTNGRIVSGRPGSAVDSDGKKISNVYTFVFETSAS